MSTISPQFRQWVLDAADRPEVSERVAEMYIQLQDRIDQRRPVCEMSGRCCRFEEYGHRLYVTTIELAAFVRQLRRPIPISTSGCPFQAGKLCTVHTIRPFGCRVFFCDPTSQSWQQEQYEHFHARMKSLHEEFGVPYSYIEWRAALEAMGEPAGGLNSGLVMKPESF